MADTERISVHPKIHFGKLCIATTRITVQSVLELLAEGLSFEEIIRDYYPDLQVENIYGCVRYA
ncbi:DUF433 domain-containing protein [Microcoleus sp. ARI1-B5]|uniref:DUF433 domain-containing protein n=1 Tax=unclassified Microcoleus TaxID=2642155 RepID=UPI002FD5E8F9